MKRILSLILAASSLAALDSLYAARCSNNIGASNGTKKKWANVYQSRRAMLAEIEIKGRKLSSDPRAVAKRAARAAAKSISPAPVSHSTENIGSPALA